MKIRILAILMVLCILSLTGCSKPEIIPEKVQSVISNITETLEPEPQEFTEIELPYGCTIFNADMYDENTVILLLGNGIFSEYQIAFYNLDSGLTTSYSDKFHVEYGDIDYFSLDTLSVDPYVVTDYAHQMVYRFSDDFNDVTEVSTDDLGTYTYEYCALRDSLIYSVSSESTCELREYSFVTGEDTLVMDLAESYNYIELHNYYESSDTVIIGGGKLFTNEYKNCIVDLSDLSIIGEFDVSYTMHDSNTDDMSMNWFDDTANDLYVTTIDTEQGTTGAVYSIDMTDCVFDLNSDEYMFVFNAEGASVCNIDAYNIDTGVLSYSGNFDYNDLVTIPIPMDHNKDEPIDVYLNGSENFSFLGNKLLFGIHVDDSNYYNSLVIWDTSLAEVKMEHLAENTAIEYPITEIHELNYSDSNTEYAETLEAEYGIDIYYGDNIDVDFLDYDVEIVYDEDSIYTGLMALEKTLMKFPDGFFDKLSESEYMRGINFYLCGELTPTGGDATSDPAAFTYTDSGYAMVIANVYEDNALVSNFCHELSHVIDTVLIFEEYLDEEVWNSFNPEGFEYNNSYLDEEGNDFDETSSDEYTSFDDDFVYYWNTENIYFIDNYAKTFPTEDRARIIEYAMVPDSYTDDIFESEHIQSKLKYYAECIRECWDSSSWTDKTVWEQFLVD